MEKSNTNYWITGVPLAPHIDTLRVQNPSFHHKIHGGQKIGRHGFLWMFPPVFVGKGCIVPGRVCPPVSRAVFQQKSASRHRRKPFRSRPQDRVIVAVLRSACRRRRAFAAPSHTGSVPPHSLPGYSLGAERP